jgi:Xaa-Pro aminopeptidase
MRDEGLDVLLAYAPGWRRENVRYLTDAPLRGSLAFAMLPAQAPPSAHCVQPADSASIRSRGWVTDVHSTGFPAMASVTEALRELRPTRVGVAHLELVPQGILDALGSALPAVEFVSATALMDSVRLVKSDWELDRMRRTAQVCAAGWQKFVEVLRPGLPEYHIVAEVEAEMKRLGAEDNFMLIASGGSDVMGMSPPGARLLEPGDMVRTELTPQMDGYWLQLCRSAVVGKASEEQHRSFDLFNEAVEAGLSVVRPGVTAHEVARAQNDVFRAQGYGEYCTSQYTRVRGHGHGLHLDETPIIEDNHTVLSAGAVFIIHPNTYTPIAGYHVLGDPVVVTEGGYALLIDTERKLFESAEVSVDAGMEVVA